MSLDATRKGEGEFEPECRLDFALGKGVDCSVSETSDESVLLSSSHASGRRTGNVLQVRRTGLPFRPRPSLEGLPGAPVGILSLYFWGTTSWQFSHVSPSESKVLLVRRPPNVLLAADEDEEGGRLGK